MSMRRVYELVALAAAISALVWAARGRGEMSALVALQTPLWLIAGAVRWPRKRSDPDGQGASTPSRERSRGETRRSGGETA